MKLRYLGDGTYELALRVDGGDVRVVMTLDDLAERLPDTPLIAICEAANHLGRWTEVSA